MNLLIVLLLFLLTFLFAELLYRRGISVHLTRKIVHIGGGIIVASLPVLVDLRTVIILGVGFSVLLMFSKRKNLLNSIHKTKERSIGALLFTPSLILAAIIFWPINPIIFQGSALILGLSDGIAGIVGTKYGRRDFSVTGNKTIEGSFAFFFITFLILNIFLYVNGISLDVNNVAVFVFGGSLLLTIVEAVVGGGWDNLFIPLIAGSILYFAI